MGVALVWFQQAKVELYSKKEVAAGRVITTRDPNGPMPLARGHIFSLWRESAPTRMLHLKDEVSWSWESAVGVYFKHLYKIGGLTHYTYYEMY